MPSISAGQRADLRRSAGMTVWHSPTGRRRSADPARGIRPASCPSSRRGARRSGPCADSPRPHRSAAASTVSGVTCPMRSRFSSSTRCLAWICWASSRCCSAQPPQVPKCGQRGATRSGEASSTSTVRASSKLRWRAVCCAMTRLAGQCAGDEHRLARFDRRRPTPRPSWVRPVIGISKGVWSRRATEHSRCRGAHCRRPVMTGRKRERPAFASRSGRSSGTRQAHFCFQPPDASWYHQPPWALSTHCLAKTPRICASHSGWPLATATSR